MSKIFDIDMYQDNDSNIYLADVSRRCTTDEVYIPYDDIECISLLYRGGNLLDADKEYRFYSHKQIYMEGVRIAELLNDNSLDIKCHLNTYIVERDITLSDFTLSIVGIFGSVNDFLGHINNQINSIGLEAVSTLQGILRIQTKEGYGNLAIQYKNVLNGGMLEFKPDIDTGSAEFYNRGNFIGALQEEVVFKMTANGLVGSSTVPVGKSDMRFEVIHALGTYYKEFTEYFYVSLEIYKAQLLVQISNRLNYYIDVHNRLLSEAEIDLENYRFFTAIYSSFVAALDYGSELSADRQLEWLINFKTLNPIEYDR